MGISGGAEIPGHSLRPDFCNPNVVTDQLDLQNAFNLANSDDMVHAVADKLPSLLPYVLMAYQQRLPLVIQQVDGSHEVLWSEAGVRQGDPTGPLLFALTYQPTLHAAPEHAADAIVTACHDDTYLQGQEDAGVAGARRIMSRQACQPRMTLVYCADPDKAWNVAAKLGATFATGGIVACGTGSLGSDAFIAQHIQQRCDSTCAQVDKLVGLPLDPQTKWSVLHNCLQHREAHLMRNTWGHLLAAPLRQVEDALVRSMCDITGVTRLTDQQRVQVQLPHRHGGMGLRGFSEDVVTAAHLLSAALAHAALAGGSDKALPFRGAMGVEAHSSLARLQEAWPTVKGLADRPDDAAEWATICKAALHLVFGLHQFGCHAEILFADCGLLPVSALICAAKRCWKVRLSHMSAERFPVAVDSITIPGRIDTACKKGEDFNACINAICNDIHKF